MTQKSPTHGSFWAMLCHLSGLIGFIFVPVLGSLLFPLIVWSFKKDTSPLVANNGRSIINFVLSLWLYTLIFSLAMVLLWAVIAPTFFSLYGFLGLEHFRSYFVASGGIALFSLMMVAVFGAFFWLWQGILMLYASIKAANGEVYHYPFTIQFLKG
ncbi:MAG: hypothetical protein A2977_02790 [Alphaproteobacteria bacterium RIFCSPLOWO2_01_FULL_45_8]|nr:MAG: hypothetical protein A2065_03880 [Alphaproteobacteria bacterium GWB1_45_5]OFW75944.1 MAG: hypothetical protein A3K20_03930 [Alphaproteobacteria bacterium GWA1_45_9]OFW90036.1 MAG: hypothetical protein A2621_04135 [Alphaproteobacteria bacterium RIFCSPHIGHO2_01_FULL_41_14]OFW96679.1 MAG: hypothetical protein A2977_02790 [Alphaproteobacteria bacterium RIFCSPLOWO2_01_FULL_45_8]HCI49188.1 hypothetical protein [Holosporales bacterium]